MMMMMMMMMMIISIMVIPDQFYYPIYEIPGTLFLLRKIKLTLIYCFIVSKLHRRRISDAFLADTVDTTRL